MSEKWFLSLILNSSITIAYKTKLKIILTEIITMSVKMKSEDNASDAVPFTAEFNTTIYACSNFFSFSDHSQFRISSETVRTGLELSGVGVEPPSSCL